MEVVDNWLIYQEWLIYSMFHAFLPALSIVSVTDCLVGVVFLLLSKKISQTLLSLEHTVISKSGGGQLDLLNLDTSFKVKTDHPYAL